MMNRSIPSTSPIPSGRRTPRPVGSTAWVALVLLALAAAVALPAFAQPEPDPMFRDFEPIGEFSLKIDDKVDPKAEIYKSERARAILVISSELPQPLMFNLRSRQLAHVGFMSLAKRDDDSYDILADADITPVTIFSVDQKGASANVDGKTVALATRASLLGPHKASELTAYDPAYARGAAAYTPNETLIASLKEKAKNVRVQVFFNSKCHVCKAMVPRIIKLDSELDDSVVHFDYYGVPDSFTDPLMKEKGVDGVPTGIVYVNGKEVGRIIGGQWKIPELALKNTLTKAS